jgi:hypothetical protein
LEREVTDIFVAAQQQSGPGPQIRTEKELIEENLLLTRALLAEQQKFNQAWLEQQSYARALIGAPMVPQVRGPGGGLSADSGVVRRDAATLMGTLLPSNK